MSVDDESNPSKLSWSGTAAESVTLPDCLYEIGEISEVVFTVGGSVETTFTVTKDSQSLTFETSDYYTDVVSDGLTYTPADEDSVMLICTVKGAAPNELRCTLTIDGFDYVPNAQA